MDIKIYRDESPAGDERSREDQQRREVKGSKEEKRVKKVVSSE
jgi:hypothetical protein